MTNKPVRTERRTGAGRDKEREFPEQIERTIPWDGVLRPCCYKEERGNKPYDLERLLRLYLLQNLYNLSDDLD
jgi:IS5 family transposase